MTALETRLDTIHPTLGTTLDMAEVRADLSRAATEIHKGSSEVEGWIVGTAVGGVVVFITIMTFVLNNARPRAPPPQAQQAPIIINVPPPAAAPSLQQVPAHGK